MFDGQLRKMIHPVLDRIAGKLVAGGVTANQVTWAGFVLALGAAALIAREAYLAGMVVLLLSRLCDGLDGAVAKRTQPTDFGGYLDIVLDFAFYGLIPVAFAIANPGANALAACILILSFYVNGASFLAFATLAEKRGLKTEARGKKSFYFPTGIAEAGETFAVFVAFCLFPGAFAPLAWVFAAVCFLTTAARLYNAGKMFSA